MRSPGGKMGDHCVALPGHLLDGKVQIGEGLAVIAHERPVTLPTEHLGVARIVADVVWCQQRVDGGKIASVSHLFGQDASSSLCRVSDMAFLRVLHPAEPPAVYAAMRGRFVCGCLCQVLGRCSFSPRGWRGTSWCV